jgi:hypothetical protein
LSSRRQEKAWFCQAFPNFSLAVLGNIKGLAAKNLTFDEDAVRQVFFGPGPTRGVFEHIPNKHVLLMI